VLEAADVRDAGIPVIANVTAEVERSSREIRENLIEQLDHSVRWTESVRRLIAEGLDTFIEVGPGKVLTGLMRQIDPSVQAFATGSPEGIEAVAAAMEPSH
jgi:[acyl-carrier-protein] S-malonyltransferase